MGEKKIKEIVVHPKGYIYKVLRIYAKEVKR